MLTPEARAVQTLLQIADKTGKTVDFQLNPAQLAYDSQRTQRDLITKCRQKGFSSYGVAIQTIKCLGVPGTRAVLISHEAGATQRLLDKAQFYLKYIKGPKAELGRHSRNELYFPKTESTYYIGTAGAKAFGRGDTITDLHISEYAWWETDGLRHVAGLMQAVPKTGAIRIESTGNGRNNDFYYMCKHAKQLGYNLFFMPWYFDDEYELDPPQEGWSPIGYEDYFQEMQAKYNLSERKLFWYWVKLMEFRCDLKTMQQEYPSSLDECFQASGGQVFTNLELTPSVQWTWRLLPEGYRTDYLQGHPQENRTYIIGADPSGGTGNDQAAYEVFCLETNEEVESFGNSGVDPVAFGHLLCSVGEHYNNAYIVCESNNHGIAAHAVLEKNYDKRLLYKRTIPNGKGKVKYGYYTSNEGKHGIVGAVHQIIEEGVTIHSQTLKDEVDIFQEDPKTGELGSKSDNKVIAFGLACIGIQRYARHRKIDLPKPQPKAERPKGLVIDFNDFFTKWDGTRGDTQSNKFSLLNQVGTRN